MSVRTNSEKTEEFLVTIDLYQRSTLSPELFAPITHILEEVRWVGGGWLRPCSRDYVNAKLER